MKMISDTPTRTVIRYHGGKWLLAKWIIGHFPHHRTYVESFGGAASVLLQKTRCYSEVYNERDGEIVNMFKMVRDRGQELVEKLQNTPFARDEFVLSYEVSEDPLEQARRTVVRSFMGFGSASACGAKTGFRSNSRSGTTPARDWSNYPELLYKAIARLRGVVIENKDAMEVILQHDGPETLHYVDPPYVFETRSNINAHKRDESNLNGKRTYRFEMTDDAHRNLGAALNELRGKVIISGYSCPLYDELFSGWRRVDRHAFADGARKRIESIWLNFDDEINLPGLT